MAVLALEAQSVQQRLRSVEPRALPVDLQTLLQGVHLTTPETAEGAGLQTVSPQ